MNIDAVCEYLKEYARYVAPNAMSVNPHAVLAMIAEIERLREENGRLKTSPPGPVVSGSKVR